MKLLTLIVLLSTAGAVRAAEPAKPAEATGKSHSFEDMLVQGRFHFSDEAVTTVEEDKVLDSLIGVRKDFKDRLDQSAERY